MGAPFDCTACGACCVNPDENRAEGYVWFVEVRGTRLLEKRDLAKRLVVFDPDGVPHLRLDPGTGRCVALRGKLGKKVGCAIYELRPKGCRMVERGDRRCIAARAERGIA